LPQQIKERNEARDGGRAETLQRLLSRHEAELVARRHLLRDDLALEPGEGRADMESSADTAISDAGAVLLEVTARTVRSIEDALRRLDRGAYGRCLDCDSPIPAVRLQALPFAERCCVCQEQHDDAPRYVPSIT